MSAGNLQLADNAVERSRRPLRAADLVGLSCGVPKQLERPALGAMRQQAAQREPHSTPATGAVPERTIAERRMWSDSETMTR